MDKYKLYEILFFVTLPNERPINQTGYEVAKIWEEARDFLIGKKHSVCKNMHHYLKQEREV